MPSLSDIALSLTKKEGIIFTPPETRYELKLFNKLKELGYNALHNEKLYGFYPDILLIDHYLIIEVDGGIHRLKSRKRSDKRRTAILEGYGFKVVRFTNADVVRTLPQCIKTIELIINPIDIILPSQQGKKTKKAFQPKHKKARKAFKRKPAPDRYLVDSPEWNEMACKKLGIDTTKPKRTILKL